MSLILRAFASITSSEKTVKKATICLKSTLYGKIYYVLFIYQVRGYNLEVSQHDPGSHS
jgi:hypothetical protein